MTFLYLLLNIGSVAVPFIFSFHPKIKFYTYWKYLFPSIFITSAFFIIWDIIFTNYAIWGFNANYLTGIHLINLPLEEWLFFICIPYACVFTHFALLVYFPHWKLSEKLTSIISYFLIVILFIGCILNYTKWYTAINFLYGVLLIVFVQLKHSDILKRYYLTFLIMLIPFFIVNGILTGSFIENEVVWYNNQENLGIRIGTIPIEDTIYAFTLILTNLLLMNLFGLKKLST